MTHDRKKALMKTDKPEREKSSDRFGFASGAAYGGSKLFGDLPKTKKKEFKPPDPERLARLRELLGVWREMEELAVKDNKAGRTFQMMAEMVITQNLQDFVPDASEGLGGLAMSMLGPIFKILGMTESEDVCVSFWADDDTEKFKLLDEMQQLERDKHRTQWGDKRLAELHELMDPHVLIVPRKLYDRAVEMNQMEWMFRNAAAPPEEG